MTIKRLIHLKLKLAIPNFCFNRILSYLNDCLLKTIFRAEEIPPRSQTCSSGAAAGCVAVGRRTSPSETTWCCWFWGVQVSAGGRADNTQCCVSCGFLPRYQLLAGLQLRLKASIWCLGRATVRVSADRLGYHMFRS